MSRNVSSYLQMLKARTGKTQQQISDESGVPTGTLGKYFSGIEDETASFEITRKLVMTLGGSLDELADIQPREKSASIISVTPIAMDMQSIAQDATRDVLESMAYKHLHENMRWWRIVAIAELIFIVGVLIFDITHPTMGYIQYTTALIPAVHDFMTRIC